MERGEIGRDARTVALSRLQSLAYRWCEGGEVGGMVQEESEACLHASQAREVHFTVGAIVVHG